MKVCDRSHLRVSSETLDSLATFETSRADLEEGGDDEASIGNGHCHSMIDAEEDTSDDEPDHDDEPDYRQPQPVYSRGVPS